MRFIFALFVLVFLAGCLQMGGNNNIACPADAKICPDGSAVGRVGPDCEFAPCPEQNTSEERGCTVEEPWCETKQLCSEDCMDASEVRAIAQEACGSEGNLRGDIYYNNNSQTYWIDLDADMPGCSPACVVHANRSAEVIYRCTGALPP
jgi:hypothetical protein